MDKIINWWNTCNLEFQDKLNILLLQLANNNKESEVYKNTKQFLNLINKQKGYNDYIYNINSYNYNNNN